MSNFVMPLTRYRNTEHANWMKWKKYKIFSVLSKLLFSTYFSHSMRFQLKYILRLPNKVLSISARALKLMIQNFESADKLKLFFRKERYAKSACCAYILSKFMLKLLINEGYRVDIIYTLRI